MNTLASLALGVLLIIGVGGFVFWQVQDAPTDSEMQLQQQSNAMGTTSESETEWESEEERDEGNDDSQPAQPAQGTAAPAPVSTGISAASVAKHSTRESCWTSINGNVYDLTSWIPKHPGGEQAILQLCGGDGSAKFNGMHGGDGAKLKILSGFKIGSFAN